MLFRLECSGAFTVQFTITLNWTSDLSASDSPVARSTDAHHVFFFSFFLSFCSDGVSLCCQVDLKLWASRDRPASMLGLQV